MGLTLAQKILMRHAGLEDAPPGSFLEARLDLCLGNDITAPLAIEEFRKAGFTKVFDRTKVVLVPDHFAPAKDARSANQCRMVADFARQQNLTNYFEVGCMGIEHALLPERGLIEPGFLVIGADSHTCTYGALGAYASGVGSTDLARAFVDGKCWFKVPETIRFIYKGKLPAWVSGKDLILYTIGSIGVDGALYRAMEFAGPVIERLDMDSRFAMSNMAIEAGARAGLIEPDAITVSSVTEALRARGRKVTAAQKKKWLALRSDPDAAYEKVYEWEVTGLEPQVACPHLPSNVKGVSQLGDVRVDQVVIGSCTNGRISDLRTAALLLRGKKCAAGVRLIVIPATQKIYRQAVKEGLARIFVEAGGVFSTPTCGPCLGGHIGILAAGETALATTNRNFLGRMGSPQSFVYLSNPAVAAASAVTGRITHPKLIQARKRR